MLPSGVACVGEAIVDFVAEVPGRRLQNPPAFIKAAGGAPANVALGLARLGTPVAFAGKVGEDPFGHFVADALLREGVNTSGICFDSHHRTRLAFVSLTASGERDFAFWETSPADEQLRISDLDLRELARNRIVHISSFLLLAEPARSCALRLAATMQKKGPMLSFDPNLRLSLWPSRVNALRLLRRMTSMATLVRLNQEEARFLTGENRLQESMKQLLAMGPRLVVVTRGRRGCAFATDEAMGIVDGFAVRAIDTTGCGDAFLAALLHRVASNESFPEGLPEEELRDVCRFANAAGTLTALSKGAAEAMPTVRAITEFARRMP